MRNIICIFSEFGVLLASFYFAGCALDGLFPLGPCKLFRRVLVGACSQVLLWSFLTYMGLPMAKAFVFGILFAAAGGAIWLAGRVSRFRKVQRAAWEQEDRFAAAVFVLALLFRSIPLFLTGPQAFCGGGHMDLYFYVSTAEILKSESLDQAYDRAQTRAWEADVVRFNKRIDQRLGAVLPLAYCASVMPVDAKSAYGACSVFYAALLATALAVALRVFGVSQSWAAIGAVWAMVCPSLVGLEMQNYLAQVSVLCVPLALLAGCRFFRDDLRRFIPPASILLGFALTSYTEFFPIFLVFFALLVWFGSGSTIRVRLTVIGSVLGLSLALNLPFLPRAMQFAFAQFAAARGNISEMASLAPHIGTLSGWAEQFWPVLRGSHPSLYAAMNGGFLVLAVLSPLSLCFLTWVSPADRRLLIAALVLPVGGLIALRSLPDFHSYAYFKLITTFVPLFLFVMVAAFGMLSERWLGPWGKTIFIALWISPALAGTYFAGMSIIRNHGLLEMVNGPELRKIYSQVENCAGRQLWIIEDNPTIARWLLYYSRGGNVRIDRSLPGWPEDDHAFFVPGFQRSRGQRELPILVNHEALWDPSTDPHPVRGFWRLVPWPEYTNHHPSLSEITGFDVFNFTDRDADFRAQLPCATTPTVPSPQLAFGERRLFPRLESGQILFDLSVPPGRHDFYLLHGPASRSIPADSRPRP